MELCGVFLEDLTGVLRSVGALNGSIVDPGAAPKPVLDGLTAVVTGLATRAPVFMFFDDVHRADDSFWEALEHFAHQLADDPIVVLAAARDRDLADQPSATEVIHRLEEDGLLRRIAVDPIDEMNTPGREGAAVSEGVPDSLEDPAAALVIARGALARGDLDGVVTALAELEQPEAHELLARVRYATEDVIDCRHHWESAFRGYRDTGDLRAAARCAINLGRLNYNAFGHEAVSRGWLARAARLIDHVGRCVERGYLELALVACDVWDVSALEASAALALELAIEFGDSALEARALADSGLALVSQGRITEGFARLDEAMIPITAGELNDRVTAGAIFCAMLSACERAGDIRRAEEWAGVCAELMLDPAGGRPPVLHAHCRIVYGTVLCTAGKWAEAETEILRAIGPSGTRYVTKRAEAIGRLAELRVRQGRLEEAAGLLEAVEDRYEVAEPLARLHFARGELDLAGAVIDRTLRQLVGDRLRSGPLLVLLVELELARGDLEAAGRAASRLAECSDGAESVLLRAQAARSAGLLAAKRGEWDLALRWFQVAQAAFPNDEQPFLSATLRLDAAEVLAAAGDTAAAVSETRAALALFERVGACSDADRASAFLRSLGAPARRRSGERAAVIGQLSSREQQVLRLLGEGLTNADIGQRLYITSKTAEHHVSRILTKLGVRTRAEAAAMAAALVVAPA
jgi:DNA-binding CsgD family transcriptional regulator